MQQGYFSAEDFLTSNKPVEWPWSHIQDNYLPKSMVGRLTNAIIKTTPHAWVAFPISITVLLVGL